MDEKKYTQEEVDYTVSSLWEVVEDCREDLSIEKKRVRILLGFLVVIIAVSLFLLSR